MKVVYKLKKKPNCSGLQYFLVTATPRIPGEWSGGRKGQVQRYVPLIPAFRRKRSPRAAKPVQGQPGLHSKDLVWQPRQVANTQHNAGFCAGWLIQHSHDIILFCWSPWLAYEQLQGTSSSTNLHWKHMGVCFRSAQVWLSSSGTSSISGNICWLYLRLNIFSSQQDTGYK